MESMRYRAVESKCEDRLIAEGLMQFFEHDLSLAGLTDFQFFVRDAHVRVLGSVSSLGDRDILETLIRRIPGVSRVENRIRIRNERATDLESTGFDIVRDRSP